MAPSSQMRREILEIPETVAHLLDNGGADIQSAAAELRRVDPDLVVTAARGSSDHAALYFKYLCELVAGIPVASLGPSLASLYDRPLRLRRAACLAVSQSGQSPDIVALARKARVAGALTHALTNHPDAALGQACARVLPQHAGLETSVAATKTFVTSVVSAAWLLAEWQQDNALKAAINRLPEDLAQAVHVDWTPFSERIKPGVSLLCLGRGPTLAMSHEAALKFKETCLLHAESYSSAEVRHGPMALVEPGLPILAFAAADDAETALADVADDLAAKGATVFATTDKVRRAETLPTVRSAHPLTDAITLIASFYNMVEHLAASHGLNPDTPRHLSKVTATH